MSTPPTDGDNLTRHLGTLLLFLICVCITFRPLASGFATELGSAHLIQMLVFFCGMLWVMRCALQRRLPYRSIGVAIAALVFLLVCTFWTIFAARQLTAIVTLISWTSDIILLLLLLQNADASWRRTALNCLIASAVVAACLGISQYLWGLDELREAIRNDPEAIKRELGIRDAMWQTFMSRVNTDRAFGTFVYPNALAGFLNVMLPIALGMLAGALAGLKRLASSSRLLNGRVLSSGAFVVILVICLLVTFSKGGWIAAAAAIAFMAVYSVPSSRTRVAVLAGLCVGVVLLLAGGHLFEALPELSQYVASLAVRVDYWKAAGWMSLDNYLIGGVGLRNFGDFYPAYKHAAFQEVKLAHSTPMQLLADTGIAGLLAYGAMWFLLLRGMVRGKQSEAPSAPGRRGVGLTAGAVVFLMLLLQRDISPFTQGAGHIDLVRWFGYAILWLVSFLALERAVDPGSPAVRLGLAAGCVGYLVHGLVDFDMFVPGIHVAAFVAAACACRLPVRERHLGQAGRGLLFAGCLGAAFTMLLVIHGMTPLPDLLTGESRKKEAHYLIGKGDMLKAAKCLRESAAANPLDDEVHATLSSIYWRMWIKGAATFDGRNTRQLAAESAESAARANPRSSSHRTQLARIAATEDIDNAIEHAQKAVALYPVNPHLRVLLGDLLVKVGRTKEAVPEYREALRLDKLVMEQWLHIPTAKRQKISAALNPARDAAPR